MSYKPADSPVNNKMTDWILYTLCSQNYINYLQSSLYVNCSQKPGKLTLMQKPITIPPMPKFALKWNIALENCPKNWEFVVKSSIVWALAQRLKNRDIRGIHITVQFISQPYMKKLQEKHSSQDPVLIFPDRLVCSAAVLHVEDGLFEHLIKTFATYTLIGDGVKDPQVALRRVLGKFGLVAEGRSPAFEHEY